MKPILSERLAEIPRSGIREIFDLTLRVKDVVNLGIGEPDFPTPQPVVEAAKDALSSGYTRYTPNPGIPELRAAIAKKLASENRIHADPETEIIVTVGATHAILLALTAVLREGEEVLIPSPAFGAFSAATRIAGGVPVEVESKEANRYRVEASALEAHLSPKSKVIVLNSPCNPTGAALTRRDLEAIADVAFENDLLILSDEIYEKYVYDGQHVSIASLEGLQDRVITVNGFSKTYAMTGWRLGYATGRADVVSEMVKLQMWSTTCPAAFVQKAAVAALERANAHIPRMRAEFDRRRQLVCSRLSSIPNITLVKPEGAFYVFPNIERFEVTAREFCRGLLEESKVAVVPGTAFGRFGEGHFRLSYAASTPALEEALNRIERFAASRRLGAKESHTASGAADQ